MEHGARSRKQTVSSTFNGTAGVSGAVAR